MLTDILWEEIAAAIYNRIATLINYYSWSSIPGSHIKKPTNKINYQWV